MSSLQQFTIGFTTISGGGERNGGEIITERLTVTHVASDLTKYQTLCTSNNWLCLQNEGWAIALELKRQIQFKGQSCALLLLNSQLQLYLHLLNYIVPIQSFE